ncbi:hypothetical protein SERLA73DRAFT_188408, partial [Serpula lacrymans var. lacrymans S7.3]
MAIPPIAQMTLTSTWIESLLYGCVLFACCIFILLKRRRSQSLRFSNSILILTSVTLFITATVHALLSFLQLLHAFIDPAIASKPHGADTYLMSNPLFVANFILYVANAMVQHLLMIWRLYVIFDYRWKICVLPLIALIANDSCAYTAAFYLSQPTAQQDSIIPPHGFKVFMIFGWLLGFMINLGLTGGIAHRLFRTGKRSLAVVGPDYIGIALIVIESGALMTGCTLVMMSLYFSGNVAGVIAIGVAAQVNTST